MKMSESIKQTKKQAALYDKLLEVFRVLVIEDNPGYAEVIQMMLEKVRGAQFDVVCAKKLSDGLQYLKDEIIDVVLVDLTLPDSKGIDTYDAVYAHAPDIPIIVLTVTDNDALALTAIQKGAQDYLIKERVDGKLLEHSIRYAIERKRVEEGVKKHRSYLEGKVAERTIALRESEGRYRTFFEQSNDVIFVTRRDGTILDVNQATIDLFGYSREEMMSMQIQKLYVDSADRIRFQQLIESEGSIRDFEVQLRKKDGTHIHCMITATLSQAADGSMKGYQGIIRDVTDRKRIETQLREQALIFENIHDGIIMTDLEGNIMSWNPAAERMFGYYEGDVFHKTIGMLTTKVMQGSLQDDRWTGEIGFIRKDGTEGICETTVIPLRDEENNIIAMFGVCRDVTERKKSEERLQQSYEHLRETLIATVNILASTIEMRDPYTAGHQRRVTTLACAIAEEMGLSDDQFDGLRMAGLIHDLGKINVPTEILSKPGQINDIEFSIIKYHPQICHDILKKIELPWPVAKIVLHHHERLDGSGYPQGLKGDEIMLEARILAVADVVEAMASHRPYRPALGIKLALQEITQFSGTLYDPVVVDVCLKLFNEKNFSFE
jgi:PAS domain S-box-containing protein